MRIKIGCRHFFLKMLMILMVFTTFIQFKTEVSNSLNLEFKEFIGNAEDNFATNLGVFGKIFSIIGYTKDATNGRSRYFAKFDNNNNNNKTDVIDNYRGKIDSKYKYSYPFDVVNTSDKNLYSVGHTLVAPTSNSVSSLYTAGCEINGNEYSDFLISNFYNKHNRWNVRSMRIIGNKRDIFKSIKKTNDKGFIAVGISDSTEFKNYYMDFKNNQIRTKKIDSLREDLRETNIAIAKIGSSYSNNGLKWLKFYGGEGFDEAENIYPTSDGGFVVIGNSTSKSGDVTENKGGKDILLLKIDANGNLLKEKSIGGPGDDVGNSVITTADGGYIITGNTNAAGDDILSTEYHGGVDAFVAKVDANFRIVWSKCFGGTGDDYANKIINVNPTEFMISGYSNSNDGDVLNKNKGANDAFVFKISINGELIWSDTAGGNGDDKAEGIKMDNKGDVFVVGSSNSNDGDFARNQGGYDIFRLKLAFDEGDNQMNYQSISTPIVKLNPTVILSESENQEVGTHQEMFTPQDVSTVVNAGEVLVKDWKKDACRNSNLTNDYEIKISTDDNSKFEILPKVNKDGYLQFEMKKDYIGIINCMAKLSDQNNIIEAERSFKIEINPYDENSLLSSGEFITEFKDIKNNLQDSSNSDDVLGILSDYNELLMTTASKEDMVRSFKDFMKILTRDFSEYFKNEEVLRELNNISARIIENSSVVTVPSYQSGDKTGTVMKEEMFEKASDIFENNKAVAESINTILQNSGVLIRVESIIKFESSESWNSGGGYFEIPSMFINESFSNGIQNVLVDTDFATIGLKKNSLNSFGTKVLVEVNNIGSTYGASDLAKFDLKMFVDSAPITNFDGNISVQLPFDYPDEDTEHMLTVQRENPDMTLVNMGGIYNDSFKRMVFMTNHFSVYMINMINNTFSDLNSVPWAGKFISALAAKGIVSGKSTNTFAPNDLVKREEFASMTVNLFKLLDNTATSNFVDVATNAWFYEGVSSALKHKIMKGQSTSVFGTGANIIKQDVATVIANTLIRTINCSYPTDPTIYTNRFGDASTIMSYAVPSVGMVIALDIMRGDTNNKFLPLANMTRAQVSVALYNALLVQSAQGLPYGLYDVPENNYPSSGIVDVS